MCVRQRGWGSRRRRRRRQEGRDGEREGQKKGERRWGGAGENTEKTSKEGPSAMEGRSRRKWSQLSLIKG